MLMRLTNVIEGNSERQTLKEISKDSIPKVIDALKSHFYDRLSDHFLESGNVNIEIEKLTGCFIKDDHIYKDDLSKALGQLAKNLEKYKETGVDLTELSKKSGRDK